jgi:hypothetical protein
VGDDDGEGDVAVCDWGAADRGGWPRNPEAGAPMLSEVWPIRGESASSAVPPPRTRDITRVSAPFSLISALFCTEFSPTSS